MKRSVKVTLKTLAILAIVAGMIAVGPGWGAVIGFFVIIAIIVLGELAEWISKKKGWPPFGGPWHADKDPAPQLTEGDHEDPEERKEPQAR